MGVSDIRSQKSEVGSLGSRELLMVFSRLSRLVPFSQLGGHAKRTVAITDTTTNSSTSCEGARRVCVGRTRLRGIGPWGLGPWVL